MASSRLKLFSTSVHKGAAALVAVFTIAFLALPASAASWPPGTLSNTETEKVQTVGGCTVDTTYFAWKFTDPAGVAHTFPGNSQFIVELGSCKVVKSTTLNEWSSDYQYYLQATGATGSVTAIGGYVNPKFIIMGVTYAPAGPSSFVNYSNSNLVGTETDINNSFSSQYTNTIAVQGGISGWGGGTITGTSTTQYTQESDTSSSITVTQETGRSDQTYGPVDPYSGINHDNDVIWLWLNPVVRLGFTGNSTAITGIQQLGYGYSTLDQPAMDVYPVFVGWLNGDIPMPSSVQQVLNRTWAASQVWPSGQGPGLTSADLQNILNADPYGTCTSQPTTCPTTVDGTRYTGPVSGENFIYQQACVGCNPGTQTYTDVYTNTNTQGQGAKYTFQQTFALEEVFNAGIFGIGVKTTTTQQFQFTWVHQWDQKITTTNKSSAQLSITGPPCTVVLGVCNPLYSGPTDFDVYEDNIYGTFLFFPVR